MTTRWTNYASTEAILHTMQLGPNQNGNVEVRLYYVRQVDQDFCIDDPDKKQLVS